MNTKVKRQVTLCSIEVGHLKIIIIRLIIMIQMIQWQIWVFH